ncbi:MAG: hypothetical protein NXY59_00345 [Aigarchaeota archaeon]|nr:hypothetical protein [Candidatus Pelearchaeum maunauluense]
MEEQIPLLLRNVRITLIAAIILAIIAATASATSDKALMGFTINTMPIILFSLITFARLSPKKDVKSLGEAAIQGLWITTSLGLVYLTLAPAAYFALPQTSVAVIMLAGAITTITGAVTLYRISKTTGVGLSA